ncbi:putative zinc-binding metallopeptidase [Afifella sp. YEN Y35]|uniref:zinc-binding metallopeptidase family protein n=1 Tax=Afifella sp. YEN Y35 TaxID=3388337 RepID=UPI0039DFD923
MKLFSCPVCSQILFFENTICERCRSILGYEPHSNAMLALEDRGGHFEAIGDSAPKGRWTYCANAAFDVCNWLIPADSGETFCAACRHNLTVPDLSAPENRALWRRMEAAKHRMIYTAMRLRLPLLTRSEHPEGLGFAFLADAPQAGAPVMTGHDNGEITIALAEADDAERERRRITMGEPYRTLLGHFRHEVGHWYWDRLVRDGQALEACRAIFGDDRADYGDALKAHYAGGPHPGWQDEFVSAYAAAHPWEDFAETWAHYFHLVDTVETAQNWGISTAPSVDADGHLTVKVDLDVFADDVGIGAIMEAGHAVTAALNAFNRAMGLQDLYPFVLSPTVVGKLGFIHDLVHARVGEVARQTSWLSEG